MTPLEIEILLHIYCVNSPVERAEAPAVKEAIAQFFGDDLIALKASSLADECPYLLKKRGIAYVEILKAVPLPVANVTWTLPCDDLAYTESPPR